jgi:hypothetical protein
MATPSKEVPSEYRPGSTLRCQIDKAIVTASVVHVFTPFTYSQVLLVQTHDAHTFGQNHLPKNSQIIAKIHDVRYINGEREGIYNERLKVEVEKPHPWSYDLEERAAQKRKTFSYAKSDGYPERPDSDEEDALVWENWIFHLTEVRLRDEVLQYQLCKPLQGHGIPRFYASGTLCYSNSSTKRAVSTQVILLEYIRDAKTLDSADPASITPAIVESLIKTVNSFTPLGLVHGDLNDGNILISVNPPRGTIIDFGVSGIRRPKLTKGRWEEIVDSENDIGEILRHLRRKLKGCELSKYPELNKGH